MTLRPRWLPSLAMVIPLAAVGQPTPVTMELRVEVGVGPLFPEGVVAGYHGAVAGDVGPDRTATLCSAGGQAGDADEESGGADERFLTQVWCVEFQADVHPADQEFTWRTSEDDLAPFPYELAGAAAAIVRDEDGDRWLFVAGGATTPANLGTVGRRSADAVLEAWGEPLSDCPFGEHLADTHRMNLDAEDPEWLPAGRMRVPRVDFALAPITIDGQERIVAVGGSYHPACQPSGATRRLRLDQGINEGYRNNGEWQACRLDEHSGMFGVAPRIQGCSLGYLEFFAPELNAYEPHPETGVAVELEGDWRELDPATLVVPRNQVAVATVDGCLIVAGGTNSGGEAHAGLSPATLVEQVCGREPSEMTPDDWSTATQLDTRPPRPINRGVGASLDDAAWFLTRPATPVVEPRLTGYYPGLDFWVELDLLREDLDLDSDFFGDDVEPFAIQDRGLVGIASPRDEGGEGTEGEHRLWIVGGTAQTPDGGSWEPPGLFWLSPKLTQVIGGPGGCVIPTEAL